MKLNRGDITKKLRRAKQTMLKFHFIGKPFYFVIALLLLCSHDLYIKMETYFLEPNQKATLSLYNGTFEASENIIDRNRMLDASIIVNGKKVPINPNKWKDQDSTITQLSFNTGEAGTYVAGVSTKARNIDLNADKFNSYLKHDGVLDMLEKRTKENQLNQDAVERYEKHVKAIYQVGEIKTNDWSTKLGYPIEFVPQANPYEKYSGEKLQVQLLLNGKPLANGLVFADFVNGANGHTHDDHSHDHDQEGHSHNHKSQSAEAHTHTGGQQLRTDTQGMINVDLPEDGIYYLRTIHMTEANDSDTLTHRSKWATLTFEVTHKHDISTHNHDHEHDHEHEGGISTWMFVLASFLIIGVLFFIFSKRNNDA